MPHKPSCAARIRATAATSSWTLDRTVAAIVECCGVSRLRAHRLARGWTLRHAVDELRRLCARDGIPQPGVDEDQLAAWEKGRMPRGGTMDLLCRLYETDAQGLGLAGAYHPDTQALPPARPAPLQQASPGPTALGLADPVNEAIEAYRRALDSTLASTTASATHLEVLDEQVMDLRRVYISASPAEMLLRLLRTLEEVRLLASDRQPATVQVRLSEMIAVLATLVADALMKLGRLDQARMWYGTARAAADDAGGIELRSRVRVQAAMLPYYYGPLERAAGLARDARLLNRGRATSTGAFAAAAEARALARLGDGEAARTAISQALDLFERAPAGPDDDAWAFPRRRLLLYLSGAFTALGEVQEALRVQQEALALYPDRTGIDPALLRLEEAMCMVHQRSAEEACQLASSTYLEVPEELRTEILGVRTMEVIRILPVKVRETRAARQLGELLALPASRM
ncbi:helix-turn-helix domain-containing protein [Kitasatospora sp. NPDC127111]|uniref:helix-turn-helix domain-containing protein n=1 Tax=Kitasatospora sp. NPDC127111 TaxID=3345363 RepID=UPI00362568E3